MPLAFSRKSALSAAALTLAGLLFATSVLCPHAQAQSGTNDGAPKFTPGNLVVVVEGCGVNGGTCTSIPNGTGTGAGNSSVGGYGDNQGAPVTLFQYTPNGTTSVQFVNSFVLPQAASGANLPISGEYGSSSEGSLSLSGAGQYLVFGAYGINAATFNANPTTYGAAPSLALAQSGSLTTQSTYTPIPRTVVMIDPAGNVNSSTAVFNVFNNNNPRSVYTLDGVNAWISGQGNSPDKTGGVFYTPLGAVNNAPVSITGLDTSTNTATQDTRNVQVYNGTLYVSVDSKEGSGAARSYVGTLGTPPATSLYANNAGPTQLTETSSSGGSITSTSKITLTAPETNGINSTGLQVNLSPSGFYFASPSVLYVADTGLGKQTAATSSLGDGGLQKWVNSKADGSGTWVFEYTIAAGLNLVANTATAGTTGLYALTGTVSGSNVYLYATNYTVGDLDQRYLYGFTDVLAATTKPSTSFTVLATAPADSNFKGVSFAPSYPAGSATLTTVPSGLTITTAGTGCVPGTYVTPVTLVWTPGSTCSLTTTAFQANGTTPDVFAQWNDNTTSTTDMVIAPSTSARYTATFAVASASLTTSSNSVILGTPSTTLTTKVAYTGAAAPVASGITFTVNGSSTGVGATTCTGTTSPIVCTATFASSTLALGSYPIVATSAASTAYPAASTNSSSLTVTAATDFSFTAIGTTTQTVNSGSNSATFTFALGLTQPSFPATVTFAAVVPPNATYTISPTSVTATGGAQTITLTVLNSTLLSQKKAPLSPFGFAPGAIFASFLVLPLCLRRRLRGGVLRSLSIAFFAVGVLGASTALSGCSGNNKAPTQSPINYGVVVTATSGTVSHSATVTLTVQP